MLPFVLKVADRPVERLQRVNAENEPIDVNVQIELYSRELNRVDEDTKNLQVPCIVLCT